MILDAVDRIKDVLEDKYVKYISKVIAEYGGEPTFHEFAELITALPEQIGAVGEFGSCFVEEVRTQSDQYQQGYKKERHEVTVHVIVSHPDIERMRYKLRRVVRGVEMTIENEARKEGDIEDYYVEEKIYSPSFEDGGIYVAGAQLRVIAVEYMEIANA